YEAPYVRTVARYTDNYILMLSASKIFSYAGQRIAIVCVSDRLFDRHFPDLAERYHDAGVFGPTFIASILYMITSGCTYTTQLGYAEMLRLSCEGKINFVEDTKSYAIHAQKMKQIFCENGFTITYPRDMHEDIADGFFFSLSYPGMTGSELVKELIHYGVSSINLDTTGSLQQGVRACTSRMRDELYPVLEERMKLFKSDHKVKKPLFHHNS
ncbi:MAG: pyridoxal phosphate-dependent aminotransferase, partial [Bacteroidales bacterium]|nr:pyridoxal phosphate-dependent aminotransferase [Bacteroidales bacterium]